MRRFLSACLPATSTAFVVVTCLSLLACHSWRVEPASPSSVLDSLHPARVRITAVPDGRFELRHPRLVTDTLLGFGSPVARPGGSDSAIVAVPVDRITRLETLHGNVLKTIGLVYLVALALAIPFALGNGSSY